MTPEEMQLHESMRRELEKLRAESDRLAHGSWWYRLIHSWAYWRRRERFDRRLNAMFAATVRGLEHVAGDTDGEYDRHTRDQAAAMLAEADRLTARKKALEEVRLGLRSIEDL